LSAASYGDAVFQTAQAYLGSWFGKLVLLGVVFSLWYHLCNGLRHLRWDTGRGFEMDQVRRSGIVVVIAAVVLTAATILLTCTVGG